MFKFIGRKSLETSATKSLDKRQTKLTNRSGNEVVHSTTAAHSGLKIRKKCNLREVTKTKYQRFLNFFEQSSLRS